jgi:hypothetical protein
MVKVSLILQTKGNYNRLTIAITIGCFGNIVSFCTVVTVFDTIGTGVCAFEFDL